MVKVRISQIFSHSMEDVVAAKKELDAGTPFESVVQQYSTCPSKNNGGDLGWMPEGAASSLLGATLAPESKGQILGPVHSPYGYHILRVADVEVERVEGPFNPGSSMQDVNRMFPDAHSLLFKQFHFGLPVGGYKAGETLASVSKSHSKAEGEVVNFLNAEFAKRQIALISSRELKDRLERNPPKPVLLDIREQWEWDIAYIPNSQRITRDNCESLLSGLAKDAEIVLIDWKQDRGPDFSRWLSQRGFTQVKCLEGGIDDWAAKVEPQLARYDIDEDDGYRYEDIIEGHAPDGHP